MIRRASGCAYCWSVIAYAYAEQPRKAGKAKIRRWIDRWQDRDDYQPWMLTNVHELCRVSGDKTAGRQAVAQALAMPADHMQSQLRLWAAHDALVDGDQQLALKQFMGVARLEHLEGLEKLLHHWVEAVIVAQQSTDKAATFVK